MRNKLVSFALMVSLLSGMVTAPVSSTISAATIGSECRYGITVASWSNILPNDSVNSYDLPMLGIGYYLDWKYTRGSKVPGYIPYLPVLSVSNANFQSTYDNLPAIVAGNPSGTLWILGNEPDDGTGEQDDVTPQVYGQRAYAYAKRLRQIDPLQKIGFGAIIMGTPLRILYLQFAWNEFKAQALVDGNDASAFVDVWTPHGFILNEVIDSPNPDYQWGSKIPPGMNSYKNLAEATKLEQLDSMVLFTQRIERYRQFMADNGERNKPMWLTEFGNLAPSKTHPADNFFTMPESRTAAFMVSTFEYLETKNSGTTGMPTDSNRLVQKWFWYSLNDSLFHFGGTLIDPSNMQRTLVGDTYRNYELDPLLTPNEPFSDPDFEVIDITARPIPKPAGGWVTDYYIDVRVRNNVIHNHLNPVNVKIAYNGNTQSLDGVTARCGGDWIATFRINNLLPGDIVVKGETKALKGIDHNNTNDSKTVTIHFFGYLQTVPIMVRP